MAKEETLKVNGMILEPFGNAFFSVKLDTGSIVKAGISGKIRINKIKIATGDRVEVDMSPYDLTKGRICRRL